MRWSSRVLVLVSAIAGHASCSARVTETFELQLTELEAGFVVLGRADGAAEQVSEPFGVSAGQLSFGALPKLKLAEDGQSAVLLALDLQALERAVPGFYPDLVKNLRAVIEPPPEIDHSVFSMEDLTLRVPLPADLEIFAIDYRGSGALLPFEGDRAALLGSLSLVVPIDPERCRIPGLEPLTAFTDRVQVPPFAGREGSEYQNFDQLVAIDRHTVLARTNHSVRLLRRGQSPGGDSEVTSSSAGTVLYRDIFYSADTSEIKWFGIALDRPMLADGTYRVLLAGAEHRLSAPDVVVGVLYELIVTAEAIQNVRVISEYPEALLAVAIDADGTAILAGQLGNVFLLYRDGRTENLPRIFSTAYAPSPLLGTGDPAHPWAIGSTGVIYLYDQAAGVWDDFTIPFATGLKPVDVDALVTARAEDGRTELWASGASGVLLRKLGEEPWRIVDLVMPPRFERCATGGDYPRMYFDGHLDAMVVAGEYLLLTVRGCTALMQVRRRDQCVALLEEADRPLGLVYNRDVQAMSFIDGAVVAGGERGVLLSSARE